MFFFISVSNVNVANLVLSRVRFWGLRPSVQTVLSIFVSSELPRDFSLTLGEDFKNIQENNIPTKIISPPVPPPCSDG